MLVYLDPLDTLFFRDSRPFDAGADSFAESTLPSPMAIYGALGNYILESNGKTFDGFLRQKHDEILGAYSPDLNGGNLRVTGVFLAKDGELFFPVPANLRGYPKRDREPSIRVARPCEKEQVYFRHDSIGGLRPLNIPYHPSTELHELNGLIDTDTLAAYLRDNLDQETGCVLPRDELLIPELRYGTRIDNSSLMAADGYLYAANHLRFQPVAGTVRDCSIAVSIDGIETLPDGVGYLGGERRAVRVHVVANNATVVPSMDDALLHRIAEKGRFLLYLLTPAVFAAGWRPECQGLLKGASLVGTAVGKPEYLSGWVRDSMTGGRPRESRKAVPAGSVYFFEGPRDWSVSQYSKLSEWITSNSISDQYRNAGFGFAAIGAW